MKPLLKSFSVLLITLSLGACDSEPNSLNGPEAVLFRNVHVIDVASGTVREQVHMAIDSGRIISISAQAPEPSVFHKVIDGAGAYVLPGLTESINSQKARRNRQKMALKRGGLKHNTETIRPLAA